MTKKSVLYFLPAIGWLLISTLLLIIPGSSFPKEDWLSKIWFDKWVHIGMFALLVSLYCWAFYKSIFKEKYVTAFFWISALAIAYGIGMEFVQKYWVSNRSFDGGDIIADCIGSVTGFLFSSYRYKKN